MSENKVRARMALSSRDDNLAHKYADERSKRGFRVIKPSSRGVSFEGTVDLFESTFQTKIDSSDEESKFEASPVIPPELGEGVANVYFPSKPIFFD